MRRALLAGSLGVASLAAALWRGASYDAAHRCPGDAPEVLRGVAVEVRAGTFGDRVLALPEARGGVYPERAERVEWGFVASVPSGKISVGERVEVSGAKVSRVEDFLGNGGQIFPYANLMRSRGFCFEAKGGGVAIVGESAAPLDRLRIFGARTRARIASVLPPVEAALSAGALLGGSEGLGEPLEDAARRAGLTHALALSGANVAIFAGAIDFALRRFAPRRARILGGTLAAWLLVAVAGLPASGVRAAFGWSVGAAARLFFRRAEAPRALLYACLVYAWWNPLALAFDVSLQLSVLACLGIAAWAGKFADRLVVPGPWGAREAVAMTLAASAATIPISAWAFGQVSLVAPVSNALVAKTIELMMWAGLAAAIAAPLPSLAATLGPLLALPAKVFAAVATYSGSLAWAARPVSRSAPVALAGSVSVALLALASISRARRRAADELSDEIARLERAFAETL